jgi:hypothetical protein
MKVNNPMEIINMIKNGQNPQQVLMSILEGDLKHTPMGANLLELAKNNQTDAITNIVKNICNERGIDFDKEFTAFKQMLGVK